MIARQPTKAAINFPVADRKIGEASSAEMARELIDADLGGDVVKKTPGASRTTPHRRRKRRANSISTAAM